MYAILVFAPPVPPIHELTRSLASTERVEARLVSEITPRDRAAMAVIDLSSLDADAVSRFCPGLKAFGGAVILTPPQTSVPAKWEEKLRKAKIPVMHVSTPIRRRKLLSLILSEHMTENETISERERAALSALRLAGPKGMTASDLALHIWGSSDIWAMARLRQTLYRLRQRAGHDSVRYHQESKLYTAPTTKS